MMQRRTFLGAVMITPLAMTGLSGYQRAAPQPAAENEQAIEAMRRNWKALLVPNADVTLSTEPLRRSEAEWKKILSKAQFDVLRDDGTERAFSSPLDKENRPGVYVCAGCGLPLFTSRMKFDSGTGWPSFVTHIPGHVGTKKDYKLILPRIEYHCVRCGGHQGHLFDDGPPPTKQRWCNNGVALRFIPA
jgi:peptide-methionine (R)-S-oxide reductase